MGGKSNDTTHSHDCQFHKIIMSRSIVIMLICSVTVTVAGLQDGQAGHGQAGQGQPGQGEAGEHGQHAERGRDGPTPTAAPLDVSQDIDPDAEDEEAEESQVSNYEHDPASVDFYFLPPLGNTSCWCSRWTV